MRPIVGWFEVRSALTVADAAQVLASAEQKYARNYQAALRADWTESHLRGFGLDAPSKKAGGRPSTATRQTKSAEQP